MHTPLSPELKEQFECLANQLSPENLSCDGEAPISYVRKRRAALMRDWERLEQLAGRKVTEDELYNF